MSIINSICEWVARRLNGRIITRGWEGEPYLARYYIFRRRMLPFRAPSWLPGVYLHHFLVDDDKELHNHPWSAVSLILSGGYLEERMREDGCRYFRRLLPGKFNRIRPNDFHRVELLDQKKGCWSLFFYGSKVQSWGFWNAAKAKVIDWREHRQQKRMEAN
jgi:hypothetical protein